MAASGATTLIDVRLPSEQTDGRFAERTVAWIPFDRSGPASFITAIGRVVNGDPQRPVTLICEIGERSEWARRVLTQAGYANVTSIDQGYRGWRADNLPMVASPQRRQVELTPE